MLYIHLGVSHFKHLNRLKNTHLYTMELDAHVQFTIHTVYWLRPKVFVRCSNDSFILIQHSHDPRSQPRHIPHKWNSRMRHTPCHAHSLMNFNIHLARWPNRINKFSRRCFSGFICIPRWVYVCGARGGLCEHMCLYGVWTISSTFRSSCCWLCGCWLLVVYFFFHLYLS